MKANEASPASAPGKTRTSAVRLALGCVTFGREIDEPASFDLMDYAVQQRIGFFDTAAAYSQGGSEMIVGKWLAQRTPGSLSPLVATKILPPYRLGAIEGAVADCARRLGTPVIDVLFLHRWDDSLLDDIALSSLDGLVRSGRVNALGVSNFTAEQLEGMLQRQRRLGFAPIRWLQNVHNYAVRGFDPVLADLCRRSNIQRVAYSPLGAGFLTGKHQQGVEAGSRFAIIPGHQDVYFNDTARSRLARLQEVARQTGRTTTELALVWALHQPEVDLVLTGGRHRGHLDQALVAQKIMAPELLARLED